MTVTQASLEVGIRTVEALEREIAKLENRGRELTAVLSAMKLVGSSLDLDEVLDRAIKSSMEVMNAEAASILLRDNATGELYFRQAAGLASGSVREIRIPRGHGIAGWVAESGEPLVVEDAQNDPRFFRGADDHTGFVTRNILAIPLKVNDTIIGVAEAINKAGGRFTETDLPLFSAFASLAAVAISNARMHQTLTEQEVWAREIDIAKQIQNSLQGPAKAAYHKFRFHALTSPARSVGGDFYDWMELGDRRTMAVIADVSGKGIPAALLMSNTISRLRSEAMRLIEPGLILKSLNDALALTSQRGLFVTIFLALFDTDGTMTYSSAGHHMPLLLEGGGFRKLPSASGPPVAIIQGAVYPQKTVQLTDGDLIVMFTDGVTEAQSAAGEFFGYEGLMHVVEAGRERPDLLPSKIHVAVSAFETGIEQSDDITVGIVSYGGARHEFALNYAAMTPDDLEGLRSELDHFLESNNIDEKNRTKIVLAIDEACTNIIRHAYGGEGGPVEFQCRLTGAPGPGRELHFQLTDFGTGVTPCLPEKRCEELKPGGLGLVILKEVMSEVRFESGSAGGCILRMKKTLE